MFKLVILSFSAILLLNCGCKDPPPQTKGNGGMRYLCTCGAWAEAKSVDLVKANEEAFISSFMDKHLQCMFGTKNNGTGPALLFVYPHDKLYNRLAPGKQEKPEPKEETDLAQPDARLLKRSTTED